MTSSKLISQRRLFLLKPLTGWLCWFSIVAVSRGVLFSFPQSVGQFLQPNLCQFFFPPQPWNYSKTFLIISLNLNLSHKWNAPKTQERSREEIVEFRNTSTQPRPNNKQYDKHGFLFKACNSDFEVHVSVFCLQSITVSAKGFLIVIVINIIIIIIIIIILDGGVVVIEFVVIIVVFNITVPQYCQYVSAYTDRELLTCYTYSKFCIQACLSLFIIMIIIIL